MKYMDKYCTKYIYLRFLRRCTNYSKECEMITLESLLCQYFYIPICFLK